MVKAGIEVPFGSRDFPELQTIYDGIHISMCTLNDEYRRRGTALITQTLKVQAFQLRIERVKLLYNQLITNVTQFHISYYREEHKHAHKPDTSKPPKTILQLAILAIFNLIQMLDLETLEYLDINRDTLRKIFLSKHKLVLKRSLNQLDIDALEYALHTTAGYIKSITVIQYKRNGKKERRTIAEAKVKAQMEAIKSQNKMAAVNEAISANSASLPEDNPTLEKAVLHIVTKHEHKKAKKKVKFAKLTPNLPSTQQVSRKQKRTATGNPQKAKKKAKTGNPNPPNTPQRAQKQAKEKARKKAPTEVKAKAGQKEPQSNGPPGKGTKKQTKKHIQKKGKRFPKNTPNK